MSGTQIGEAILDPKWTFQKLPGMRRQASASPIKPENVDAWLNPDPKNLDALFALASRRTCDAS